MGTTGLNQLQAFGFGSVVYMVRMENSTARTPYKILLPIGGTGNLLQAVCWNNSTPVPCEPCGFCSASTMGKAGGTGSGKTGATLPPAPWLQCRPSFQLVGSCTETRYLQKVCAAASPCTPSQPTPSTPPSHSTGIAGSCLALVQLLNSWKLCSCPT